MQVKSKPLNKSKKIFFKFIYFRNILKKDKNKLKVNV